MILIIAALIALGLFVLLAWGLRIPRAGWELTGAALLLGLSGYALQGHPSQEGAPKAPAESEQATREATIGQRKAMGDQTAPGQSWLILADALSRNGQFEAAAEVLSKATAKEPKSADLWVALGNALVGHSDGVITPAAQFAFQRAADIAPEHPGPPFFMGLALAQSGRLVEARALWQRLLDRSPADASYRDDLTQRLARINQMISAQGGPPPAPVAAPAAGPPSAAAPLPAASAAP